MSIEIDIGTAPMPADEQNELRRWLAADGIKAVARTTGVCRHTLCRAAAGVTVLGITRAALRSGPPAAPGELVAERARLERACAVRRADRVNHLAILSTVPRCRPGN